jgi:hypothetical protein
MSEFASVDRDKMIAAENAADEKFARMHPDFHAWWQRHPHCDPEPKFAVRARIAYKCRCYQDEFLEAKQFGLSQPRTTEYSD